MMTRNRKPYAPSFGSVSHGTMRPADLIPDFADELERCIYRRRGFTSCRALVNEARKIRDFDAEEALFVLGDLFDALNEFAPPYGYFGTHPGDGSDYGYWLHEDFAEDFDGLKVDDTGDIPDDYVGEVLHVNDHGNCTLYVKTPRKLKEIWGVV